MKIFGYCRDEDGGYGISCEVIVAESEKRAREMLGFDMWDKIELIEIPLVEGRTEIGSYYE